MKLSEKQIHEGRREIEQLNSLMYEEDVWLIEKLSSKINMENALFFECKEGEIEEGVGVCYGFFVTPQKEVHYYEYEEEFDDELDDYKSTLKLEKIEDTEKLAKEFPLLLVALDMV